MTDRLEQLRKLSPAKHALLLKALQAQAGRQERRATVIPQRVQHSPAPLSFAQQRMWFLDQFDPGITAYNSLAAIRLRGPLDITALERCFEAIVRRHEILRTTFGAAEGQPLQIIAPPEAVRLPLVDLTTLPADEREAAMLRLAAEEDRRPTALARGPLFQLRLARLHDQEHVLLLRMHHIIGDGWSIGVLMREVGAAYRACIAGQAPVFPELPIQYADYAAWQRQRLQGTLLADLLGYWRRQLGDAPPVLDLPTDQLRPAQQTFHGRRQAFGISAELTDALRALAQREGITLFMLMLAAFQTLLYRYTQQTDILVGTPMANRSPIETEELIGCFMNTLVLRGDLAGNPSFRELLGRVRRVVAEAHAHQELPFERLVEELRPERGLSHQPLFQVTFALQMPQPDLDLPGLMLSTVEFEQETVQFDLSMQIAEAERELHGLVEYRTPLFHDPTIARLIGHFTCLLEGIAADPARTLASLPLLTEHERQQLGQWSVAPAIAPCNQAIHELFEAQAARSPAALALTAAGEQLTYTELNRHADQLARHLRAGGVGPETSIGLATGYSALGVVGLLAILKAGGVAVPLDTDEAPEQLAALLAAAHVPLVLSLEEQRDRLCGCPARQLYLDSDWPLIARAYSCGPPPAVLGGQLAACVRSSDGGRHSGPAGIAITHVGAAAVVAWARTVLAPEDLAGVLDSAPRGSALALLGVLLPLCCGGTVILRGPDGQPPASQRPAISMIAGTPAALAAQLRERKLPASTRVLLAAGDHLAAGLARRLQQLAAIRRILNLYSLPAAAGCAAWADVTGMSGDSLPVGRPVAGAQIYLLDQHMQPVPIGVPGQVYIGGATLARGYLNEPGLTAERFVPNPFADERRTTNDERRTTTEGRGTRRQEDAETLLSPIAYRLSPDSLETQHSTLNTQNSRLYRTGDWARYQPDGQIELLGRPGDLAQIQGFRVRPSVVESLLYQHPGVDQAAVVVATDTCGASRLTAYAVPADLAGGGTDAGLVDALRAALAEQLPEHMLPEAIVALPALPLRPDGALDHSALPMPAAAGSPAESAAPRTAAERQLAAIFAEALGVEQVGLHENFFALGGDSISSVQIAARANRAGLPLTPRHLFQHQTIAELAPIVETSTASQAQPGLPIGPIPLTPIQHWFFEQHRAAPHQVGQIALLEIDPRLEARQLEQALGQLIDRHDALRMRFLPDGSGWQQVNNPAGEPAALSLVDLAALPEAEQQAALRETARWLRRRLHLSAGPLLRAALADLGPQRPRRLLLVIHQLVVDSGSWRIVLEELEQSCAQLCRDADGSSHTAPGLPAKTTPFGHWALHLHSMARAEQLHQELEYWLSPARARVPRLPVDQPEEPADQNPPAIASFEVALSAKETEVLVYAIPAQHRIQPQHLLLAALAQSVAGWSGATSLLIDLETRWREEAGAAYGAGMDLSRTVGWLAARFPLLLALPATESPGEMLRAIKAQFQQVPRQGIGYGLLRYPGEDTAPAAQLRALPAAQIRFSYQAQAGAPIDGRLVRPPPGKHTLPLNEPQPGDYLLELNAVLGNGRLHLRWAYPEQAYRRTTIAQLAGQFVQELRRLIDCCRAHGACFFTPSDFPLAHLSQTDLDDLLQGQQPEDIYPLSPMQQGMLFHTLYEPGDGVFVEQMVCDLHGPLDVATFEQAWQSVIDRHAILRTTFVWQGLAEPLQIVWGQAQPQIEQLDWRGIAGREQDEHLRALLLADSARGFELGSAPLIRHTLIRVAEESYRLIWSHHHILLDAWSLPLLIQEAFVWYAALGRGQAPALDPAPPYRGYIAWLRQQDLARAETFWRASLQGFTIPTPLRLEGAAAPAGQEPYEEHARRLPDSLAAALRALAQQQRLTLNTLVQGAWALLLSHISGERDVVFGRVVSGRPADLTGGEALVGLLVNTLPMRVQVAPTEPLLNWLRASQEREAEARSYEYSSLVQVHAWSELPPTVSLFESLFAFSNYAVQIPSDGHTGISIGDVWLPPRPSGVPLAVLVAATQALRLSITFDRGRFDPRAMARLGDQFQALLALMVAQPEAQLGVLLDRLDDLRRQHEAEQVAAFKLASRQRLVRRRRGAQPGDDEEQA